MFLRKPCGNTSSSSSSSLAAVNSSVQGTMWIWRGDAALDGQPLYSTCWHALLAGLCWYALCASSLMQGCRLVCLVTCATMIAATNSLNALVFPLCA